MTPKLTTAACAALMAALITACAPSEDPLPAWNDGTAKQAIMSFVREVTTPGSASFVPAPERIAVFDNDGTLWSE